MKSVRGDWLLFCVLHVNYPNMSSRDPKKKEKDKKKDSEKFDSNIDKDATDSSAGSSSGKSSSNSREKPESSKMADAGLETMCRVLKDGFDSVSNTITNKLDNVSNNFTKGLDNLQSNLDKRMTDLSKINDYDEFDRDSSSGAGWNKNQDGVHDLSEEESVASACSKGSFFKSLNKIPPVERVGEEVNQDLAEGFDRFLRQPISEQEFKELKDKYIRPKNVEWVRTPEIPFNIWRRLGGEYKAKEKLLYHVQEQLCPVMNSLVYALDKLGDGDLDGGLAILSDTASAFGYVFRNDLTDKRRTMLKAKLPDDFKILATEKCNPTPTNLLGDISENAKKVSETEKITSQMDRVIKQKPTGKKDFTKTPYARSDSNSSSGKFKRGGFFGKRYDSQKKDRRDSDRNGRDYRDNKDYHNRDGRDRQSFRRGGQSRR